MSLFFLTFFIVILINVLFFLASLKKNWDNFSSSCFECGYTSYFFSHFSFSIHYFMVALIFLFLDLELCLLMPLISDFFWSLNLSSLLFYFVILLLTGLTIEWVEHKLDWIF